MDELRNAIREKTDRNLDEMVRRTDSPFNTKILECPLPLKSHLLQLESFVGLKDPLDHITTFKMTLSIQQTQDEILSCSFPTTLKGAARVWNLIQQQLWTARQFFHAPLHWWIMSKEADKSPTHHLVRIKRIPEVVCETFYQRNTIGWRSWR